MSLWRMFCKYWFWPILALVLLYLAMMIWPGDKWRSIEADVAEKTQQMLSDEGLSDLQVITNDRGRDVLIRGSVVSNEEKDRALALAESVADSGNRIAPRVVHWEARVIPPKPIILGDYQFNVDINPEEIILSGVFSSQDEIDNAVAIAKQRFNPKKIINQLTIGEKIKPFDQAANFINSLPSDINAGSFSISGLKIALNGQVDSESVKRSAYQKIATALGSNYAINNQLVIVEPEPEPIVVEPVEAAIVESNNMCQEQLVELMAEHKIYFNTSSAQIHSKNTPLLKEITGVLSGCPKAEVEVAGHTDSLGNEAMNLTLSQSRANSVAQHLLKQDGINNTITAIGYGESQPVASNKTKAGRANNRRIEFIIK